MIATATASKTFAADHNCWDPRTWGAAPKSSASNPAGRNCWVPPALQDGFDAKAVAQTKSSGLTDLNNPLVKNMVGQSVESFFRGVAQAVPTSAPMNPERFQHLDVTPKFLMGAHYEAYNINGELMVKVSSVTRNPGNATWYDLGKVPAADVVAPSMPEHNCWDPMTWGSK